MPMPPALPQNWGIPGSEDVRLWRFGSQLKPVRTPAAIFRSLGVCIYVPASRHWLISYSPIHLDLT